MCKMSGRVLVLTTCLLIILQFSLTLQSPTGRKLQQVTETEARDANTSTSTTPAPVADSACVQRCTNLTPEYNPVCGNNRQTYPNPSNLECARNCGLPNLRMARYGRCGS